MDEEEEEEKKKSVRTKGRHRALILRSGGTSGDQRIEKERGRPEPPNSSTNEASFSCSGAVAPHPIRPTLPSITARPLRDAHATHVSARLTAHRMAVTASYSARTQVPSCPIESRRSPSATSWLCIASPSPSPPKIRHNWFRETRLLTLYPLARYAMQVEKTRLTDRSARITRPTATSVTAVQHHGRVPLVPVQSARQVLNVWPRGMVIPGGGRVPWVPHSPQL